MSDVNDAMNEGQTGSEAEGGDAGAEDLDMQKQRSIAEVSTTPGSYFRDEDYTYVNLSDGSDPGAEDGNRVMESEFGYHFDLGRASHITFLNCNFRAFRRQKFDTLTMTETPIVLICAH